MLAILPTVNDTAVKDFISCKPIFIFQNKVFWFVAPCGCITAFQYYGETQDIDVQFYESVK